LVSTSISWLLLFSSINLESTIYKFDSTTDSLDASINLLEPNPSEIVFTISDYAKQENKFIEINTSAEPQNISTLKVGIINDDLNLEITNSEVKESLKLLSRSIKEIKIL
jgi:hypothetical protein